MSSQLSQSLNLTDSVIESLPPPISQKDYFDSSFKEKGSFGIRINKGGTRTFFLIYSEGRKRKRVSIGRYPELRLKEARSKASSLLRRIRLSKSLPLPESKKTSPKDGTSSTPPLLLNDLAEKFIHYCNISGKSSRTTEEYNRLLRKEILPALGSFDIRILKKYHFMELLEDILLGRKKRVLANRVRSLLHRMFEFAVEREFRQGNPLRGISRVPESRNSRHTLSLAELRKLFFLLQSKNSESASAVLFSMLSAQPLRAVCQLTWDSIIQGYYLVYDDNHPAGKDTRDQDFNLNANTQTDRPFVCLYMNDMARSLLNMKFETRSKSKYIFSSRDSKPLRYIEKSIRQYGDEISSTAPLTARVIRNSVKLVLEENRDSVFPPLNDIEIEQFLNPLSVFRKPPKTTHNTVPINKEAGKRPSILLEQLLLDNTGTHQPPGSTTRDEKPHNHPSAENSKVIFVSREQWKRK